MHGITALVDAPFRDTLPSIQLAALSTYLRTRGINVDCKHLYMLLDEIADDQMIRHSLSHGFIGEAIMASILTPSKWQNILKGLLEYTRGNNIIIGKRELEVLRDRVQTIMQREIDGIDWGKYSIVGLSITYRQLFASMFLAQEIKRHNKKAKIVFGGFLCSDELGADIIANYEFVDYVVQGEGEKKIEKIIMSVYNREEETLDSIHGILTKTNINTTRVPEAKNTETNIDEYPNINYDDYYSQYTNKEMTVMIEGSRGCAHRCAFCNNKIASNGYRQKSTKRLVEEVGEVVTKYNPSKIIFTDNTFNDRNIPEFVNEIKTQNVEIKSAFAELRVPISFEELLLLHDIGVTEVQIGVEALTQEILDLMRKGTRVIDNIAAMKHCEQMGIRYSANLITYYPNVTKQQIRETEETIKKLYHLRPLNSSPYSCTYGSPLYRKAKADGLQIKASHGHEYFPENKTIRINDNVIKVLHCNEWRYIEMLLKHWAHKYQEGKRNGVNAKTFVSSKGTIQIYENGNMVRILEGAEASIYTYCQSPREHRHIIKEHKTVPNINKVLEKMVEEGDMYKQHNRYLSLAIAQ